MESFNYASFGPQPQKRFLLFAKRSDSHDSSFQTTLDFLVFKLALSALCSGYHFVAFTATPALAPVESSNSGTT